MSIKNKQNMNHYTWFVTAIITFSVYDQQCVEKFIGKGS